MSKKKTIKVNDKTEDKAMDEAPTLEDVTCPICLSVLVEPVTMPCSHSLCLHCFQEHVSLTSLVCPLCRVRISVWVRKNTKTNSLVDMQLWQTIQQHFPAQLEARLAGTDDNIGVTEKVHHHVSEPGSVRRDYEQFLAQENQEAERRRSKEETASIKLIQQLQEEERQRKQEQERQQQRLAQEDFMMALRLEETDKVEISSRHREMQELCAKDEDLAKRLEVSEGRYPRTTSSSHKGPMDLFLAQKGTSRGPQPLASVLSSSDPNTLEATGQPDSKEQTSRPRLGHALDSENEDTLPSSSHASPARGKENLQAGCQRGAQHRVSKKMTHNNAYSPAHNSTYSHKEMQLSPDIDSYSTASSPPSHSSGKPVVVEENEEAGERQAGIPMDAVDSRMCDVPTDVSLFMKWDKDEESLTALVYEQQRAEAQLQQELEDRLLAEALQEELNAQARKVSRSKGSEDEYSLRRRTKSSSQPGPSGNRGSGSGKRQATLSEVISKRHKAA